MYSIYWGINERVFNAFDKIALYNINLDSPEFISLSDTFRFIAAIAITLWIPAKEHKYQDRRYKGGGKVALYHTHGKLPEPPITHRFYRGGLKMYSSQTLLKWWP